MNVAVLGLWHLGSVTAACVAAAGHHVTAWDPDTGIAHRFAAGSPAVSEPGLAELVRVQADAGRLTTATDLEAAVRPAEVVWITFDTPVDDEDRADVDSVVNHVAATFPYLRDDATVLISSQLPLGTARRLEELYATARPNGHATFASSPENLRLGRALEVFNTPDRVVVGVRNERDRERITRLFAPITDRLEWMSVESAELTKHAINAFLALSVAYINELATIGEQMGADAREVERGLKTERRIGPAAYLSPGGAFAGGTLARDVSFLRDLGGRLHCQTSIMDGVQASNREHRGWARRRLSLELGSLADRRIAVCGLTYKPGTDTLRRSEAIVLCRWLLDQGANVAVHDPAVSELPDDLAARLHRHEEPLQAAQGADAIVVATEWPHYRQVPPDDLAPLMRDRLVVDANRFLGRTLGQDPRFRLISVGHPITRHA